MVEDVSDTKDQDARMTAPLQRKVRPARRAGCGPGPGRADTIAIGAFSVCVSKDALPLERRIVVEVMLIETAFSILSVLILRLQGTPMLSS